MATATVQQGKYQLEFVEFITELMNKENSFLKLYTPQALSNSVWAISKLVSVHTSSHKEQDPIDTTLLTLDVAKRMQQSALTIISVVAREVIEREAYNFNAQALSNIAWAFATIESKNNVLLQQAMYHIIKKSLQLVHQFNSQDGGNLVWAVAQLFDEKTNLSDQLFHSVGKRFLERSLSAEPQHISMTMWGFAKLKFGNDNIYRGLARRLSTNNTSTFTAQTISNTMWALATAGISIQNASHSNTSIQLHSTLKIRKQHQELINPVLQCCIISSKEFMKRPHEFNPQEISNLCWSFATLGVKDTLFLKAVEQEITSRINKIQKGVQDVMTSFNGQNIANILWCVILLVSLIIWLYYCLHIYFFFFCFHYCCTGHLQP
jgi:hypothetical protein